MIRHRPYQYNFFHIHEIQFHHDFYNVEARKESFEKGNLFFGKMQTYFQKKTNIILLLKNTYLRQLSSRSRKKTVYSENIVLQRLKCFF